MLPLKYRFKNKNNTEEGGYNIGTSSSLKKFDITLIYNGKLITF